MGKRIPYLILGALLTMTGILGQSITSTHSLWGQYTLSFVVDMIGINVMYSIMVALIPDAVPPCQVGLANGTLALLLVSGSLFGFGVFHGPLDESLHGMYGLYVAIVAGSLALTCWAAGGWGNPLAWVGNNGHLSHAEVTVGKREEAPPHRPKKAEKRGHIEANKGDDVEASSSEARQPTVLLPLRAMLYEPILSMDHVSFLSTYTICTETHHDFFVVTVSRTFYYMGISAQAFFLYFVHDVIGMRDDPEGAVATLAIVSQMAGAVTCYPIGLISDGCMGGRRKPFVYAACAVLCLADIGMCLCSTMDQMLLVCAILGGANGVYLTMDTSLAVDTLPKGDEKKESKSLGGDNGNDRKDESGAAQLLGVWGVAGFFGSAAGPLIGGPLLFLFGSPSLLGGVIEGGVGSDSDVEEYTRRGYAVLFSMSAFYFFCSAATLGFLRDKRI